jgi:hypothetical protein
MLKKTVAGILFAMLFAITFLNSFHVQPLQVNASPSYTSGWSKTYGGTDVDQASFVVQTIDGGYALIGFTTSSSAGEVDFWLVKTDSNGNKLWNKTYGGSDFDFASSGLQTNDGGYIIAGSTWSFGAGDEDFWLVKTDSNGNKLWDRTYGGNKPDGANCVIQTADGGYALAGYTASFGAVDIGASDFWLVKTDSNGNKLWTKTYGGTNNEIAESLAQTSDGGYILAGYTQSLGDWRGDFWLVKTDSNGNKLWSQTYGGSGYDRAESVIQTTDGGYAFAGHTNSFQADNQRVLGLVKTDSVGNRQWNLTYGKVAESACCVIQTKEEGFAIVATSVSYNQGASYAFWLVKTDSNGNKLWDKTYGGNGESDEACSFIQTTDGGYALAGTTTSLGVYPDFLLVKTDENGATTDSPSPTPTPTSSTPISTTATSTPTLNPTPSPSVPEFTTWLILPLIGATALVVLTASKRKK